MKPRFVLSATVLDARDPRGVAGFSQRLLGWEPGGDDDPTWVMLRAPSGTGLSFQLDPLHVAPTWPAREGAGQMQLHPDIGVDDVAEAVARAVELGAVLDPFQPQEEVRVLRDPEGHPFCLFPRG